MSRTKKGSSLYHREPPFFVSTAFLKRRCWLASEAGGQLQPLYRPCNTEMSLPVSGYRRNDGHHSEIVFLAQKPCYERRPSAGWCFRASDSTSRLLFLSREMEKSSPAVMYRALSMMKSIPLICSLISSSVHSSKVTPRLILLLQTPQPSEKRRMRT